ncbi:MAG: hypothetical protein Fur0020_14260 [Thermodesulfovibrionia bacterium]
MDIANGPTSGDTVFEDDGIRLFLEKEAGRMLANATINYTEEGGFEIIGLQRSSCCG